MSVVDDLRAAKAAIEKLGWYQGWLVGHHGGVCAVGALNIACCGQPVPQTYALMHMRDWAYMELERHLPEGFTEVWEFNDDPSTTREDVLNLFEKTIANLGGLG